MMQGMNVAVWARTQHEARVAGLALGIPARRLVPVGNRSADALHGRSVQAVVILPGALSPAVERNLRVAQMSTPAGRRQWLDLRGVRDSLVGL